MPPAAGGGWVAAVVLVVGAAVVVVGLAVVGVVGTVTTDVGAVAGADDGGITVGGGFGAVLDAGTGVVAIEEGTIEGGAIEEGAIDAVVTALAVVGVGAAGGSVALVFGASVAGGAVVVLTGRGRPTRGTLALCFGARNRQVVNPAFPGVRRSAAFTCRSAATAGVSRLTPLPSVSPSDLDITLPSTAATASRVTREARAAIARERWVELMDPPLTAPSPTSRGRGSNADRLLPRRFCSSFVTASKPLRPRPDPRRGAPALRRPPTVTPHR